MLVGLNFPLVAVLLIAGVVLDLLLGEARRWHPLVGFGRIAAALERRLNARTYVSGALAWGLAVLPPVALTYWCLERLEDGTVAYGWWMAAIAHAFLLYLCIGLRSLRDHVLPIEKALLEGRLEDARHHTSRIVSRDTQQALPPDLAKAATESVLENGNDAVFGTIFWFIVAGAPGALLFRLANTLDAMWGYRSERYNLFGWVAARTDDVLNLLPARLTALFYALLGKTGLALDCWRKQARLWSSPNAGPVMSSGAGALGILLGGAATYDGVADIRPVLGAGRPASATDIGRAWRLVRNTTGLWLGLVVVTAVIYSLKG